MLKCLEAEQDLQRALSRDRGVEVRTYCITSLGKLESRRSIDVLKQLYLQQDGLGLLAAQALARIVGVARYEL